MLMMAWFILLFNVNEMISIICDSFTNEMLMQRPKEAIDRNLIISILPE